MPWKVVQARTMNGYIEQIIGAEELFEGSPLKFFTFGTLFWLFDLENHDEGE